MPCPKDPQKLKEYKEKMSRIAKERGYGKWMKGKRLSEETKQKQRQSQLNLITPEERKRRSDRATDNGYGKWMKDRPVNPKFVQQAKERKGKTYEEIYGERAREEKEKRTLSIRKVLKKRAEKGDWPCPSFLQSSMVRKGKTYEEIYGEERANKESKKRSQAHLKKWEGKERLGCRDKKNGDHLYVKWRTAVFVRDDYTCRNCGVIGTTLHAHHIKHWSKCPELRYTVSNGVTLCFSCHAERHPGSEGLFQIKNKKE